MKKLIFALIIIPFSATAGLELTDTTIKNKFLTLVKDAEVEKLISGTTEFQSCRDDGFKATESVKDRNDRLQKATACFKSKISGKDPKVLQKLSADLKLETYGLVKSKNVAEITEYLSKKMIKSLTGRDPDEKDPKKIMEQMRWDKQKIVDHKVFIDLYTTQLTKSALFEVSRFCFENLRLENNTAKNFADHWTTKINSPPVVGDLNDYGVPSFLEKNLTEDELADPAKLVAGLTSSGAAIDPNTYGKFFGYCQAALPLLCEDFKNIVRGKTQTAGLDITADLTDIGTKKNSSKGANACLTIEKLKSIRLTMKNTEIVEKQFKEMGDDKDKFALEMITKPQFYSYGQGKDEDSPDDLTSYSSTDLLDKNNPKGDLDKMLKECSVRDSKECDEYLVKGDSLDRAINNVETTMNLKREIEMEMVKTLGKKPDDLKKYLEDNGHYEVLNKIKNDPGYDVVKAVSEIYDARKVAEIANLKLKVGKRQISEAEHAVEMTRDPSGQSLRDKVKENITGAKQERARMAQVMMFNNIITAALPLQTGTGANKKYVGRNVSGVKKELADLEKSKTYNKDLFKGIKSTAEEHGSKVDTSLVNGGTIMDSILGKQEEP